MKCKIKGCENEITYKKDQVCQKHYFRKMRYGTYELTSKRKILRSHSNGYVLRYAPEHFLSNKQGYVYEHRYQYTKNISKEVNSCELCGKKVTWKTVHIDHFDENRENNNPENLRALCNGCNVGRNRDYHEITKYFLTYNGEKKTFSEWERDSRVNVQYSTLLQRYKRGLSPEDILFSDKKTHFR